MKNNTSDTTIMNNAFQQLGVVFRAWKKFVNEIAKDHESLKSEDCKTFKKHVSKLEDTETMLALGYVCRNEELTGSLVILQSRIVNKMYPDTENMDSEELAKKRQAYRQAFKRRVDTLEFFGLVEREYLGKTAVQLSMTKKGEEQLKRFDSIYALELKKL